MPIVELNSLQRPELAVYSMLTEAQLKRQDNPDEGLFIAESPKVIKVALAAGYEPVSLLCERRHLTGDAAEIVSQCEERDAGFQVFTGEREMLSSLTGYTLTRGVLCAMRRPHLPSVEEVCRGAHRVVVIDGVVDATNVGAIFRSAAALGIDGVLLTRNSCDPFNRRAVRVSMGSVFLVPWTWIGGEDEHGLVHDYTELRRLGFKTLAMALTDRSVPIDDPAVSAEQQLAIIMGTEGEGLPDETIAAADYTVRIPMSHGVDSLNVAAASAVAFWQLRFRD